MAQLVKNLPAMRETWVWSLGWEDPLEKGQATHSSILGLPLWLSWRICLQWGRPGFDPWVGKIPWRRDRLPTQVFWPGEFHGQRSLAGYSPWDRKESVTSEQLSHAQLRKPQGTCQEPKNEWPERYRRKTKRRWSPEAKGNEFSKKGITNWVQHDC